MGGSVRLDELKEYTEVRCQKEFLGRRSQIVAIPKSKWREREGEEDNLGSFP